MEKISGEIISDFASRQTIKQALQDQAK